MDTRLTRFSFVPQSACIHFSENRDSNQEFSSFGVFLVGPSPFQEEDQCLGL